MNTLPGLRSPVHKALRLLSRLAASGGPVALPELSRIAGLSRPTAFRLAQLLAREGFVAQDPLTHQYALGPGFDTLALNALRNGPAQRGREWRMNQLAAKLGVRVNLVLLRAGKLDYVEWVNSSAPLRIDLRPGMPVPVHCSASGKLLMAFAPPALRERFLAEAPFPACTRTTLRTRAALEREFARIRRLDYAEDREEFIAGIHCLSVPIRNAGGEVVAGLAIMAPSAVYPLARCREHLADLRACAKDIATGAAAAPDAGRATAAAGVPPLAARATGRLRAPARASRSRRAS